MADAFRPLLNVRSRRRPRTDSGPELPVTALGQAVTCSDLISAQLILVVNACSCLLGVCANGKSGQSLPTRWLLSQVLR